MDDEAGIKAADAANNAQMWGPQAVLQAEAIRTGIPMQLLAQEYGIVGPLAQAFGTQNANTSQLANASSTQQGYGTGQTTTSTPFNPLSLLPLAFLPTSGANSASLAGGLFGSLLGGGSGGPGAAPKTA